MLLFGLHREKVHHPRIIRGSTPLRLLVLVVKGVQMGRKPRRWTACAMITVAIAATPMVSGCHNIAAKAKPPPVFRPAYSIVFVAPLDLSGIQRP